MHARKGEAEILSRDSREIDSEEESPESDDYSDCLSTILSVNKLRNQDRVMQTDPSSRTYKVELIEEDGGEEMEMTTVSIKAFSHLSCKQNIRQIWSSLLALES